MHLERTGKKPQLCFLGCPHFSKIEILDWLSRIDKKLTNNRKKSYGSNRLHGNSGSNRRFPEESSGKSEKAEEDRNYPKSHLSAFLYGQPAFCECTNYYLLKQNSYLQHCKILQRR